MKRVESSVNHVSGRLEKICLGGPHRVVFLPKRFEEQCRIGRPCTFYFIHLPIYVECRLIFFICSVYFHAYTVTLQPPNPNTHRLSSAETHTEPFTDNSGTTNLCLILFPPVKKYPLCYLHSPT